MAEKLDKSRKTWGLRHLALRVRDVRVSQSFYEQIFGMKVVWHPDDENVYLSTGLDNLALHQYPKEDVNHLAPAHLHPLDHVGFLMASPEDVEDFFKEISRQDVRIVKPLRKHRDGSFSFYLADPDNNTIQILYEPTVQLR
ncbi:MAG: VOC family protein [Nitrospirales bacterium]|nr:VOC family protein [Nitrospirales bacterium]